MEHEYDVLIIGGGVVGCAIARELAAYRLKIGASLKRTLTSDMRQAPEIPVSSTEASPTTWAR